MIRNESLSAFVRPERGDVTAPLLAQSTASIVDQHEVLSRREVGGHFLPDRRGVRVRVHHPRHDLEAVAAKHLRELAQLKAVVALRLAVDQDGLAQDLEPRLGPLAEHVIGRVLAVERIGVRPEPGHLVFADGSYGPAGSPSLFPSRNAFSTIADETGPQKMLLSWLMK